MDKQKQIEEMARYLLDGGFDLILAEADAIAISSHILKRYQPKIPENAVVLTREEFKAYGFVKEFFDGESTRITAGELVRALQLYDKQARKEMAEKFAERLKEDVSEDNELHEALNYYLKRDYFEYIDERCKELEGENATRI